MVLFLSRLEFRALTDLLCLKSLLLLLVFLVALGVAGVWSGNRLRGRKIPGVHWGARTSGLGVRASRFGARTSGLYVRASHLAARPSGLGVRTWRFRI